MVTCQQKVYDEKYIIIEQHRRGLKNLHRGGRVWTPFEKVEYMDLRSYRDLLLRKKRIWEMLYGEGNLSLSDSLPL